jgi:hypothetical protein
MPLVSRVPARRLGWLLAALLPLGGCATYSAGFAAVETQLAARNYEAALQALENQSHATRDRVLYLLNKGMLLRMKRDYAASNEAFEAAKQLMDQLYGLSLREQTLTFVINDASTSYVGEEYEQVLVHLYKALNYLDLRQLNEARVEALQVDLKLRQFGERIPDNKYTEDAFARYLTGLIYEELGEWSDALIAYRKAYEAYLKYQKNYGLRVPRFLQEDLLRLAQRQGLTDEVERYKRAFGINQWRSMQERAELGELVFIMNIGLAPIKREMSTALPDPNSGHIVRISLPYYESRPSAITGARLQAGTAQASTELVEDIGAIANQALNAKMPVITARAVARAAVKAAAAREARKQANKRSNDDSAAAAMLLAFAVEATTILTERADTRSWLTLPSTVQLARLPLSPGTYTVRVELLGSGSSAPTVQEIRDVVVRKGHQTFLTQHVVLPAHLLPRR